MRTCIALLALTSVLAAIGLLAGRTLDPASPDYRWEDRGPVVWSDGIEDSNAIDPGVLLAPDGKLWLTYGSYFGFIRLVELDPKTGLRRFPDRKPVDVAINSEASIPIYHDGWYYLLVTHGSCCQGANSTYNIRMGRSRKVTGPSRARMSPATALFFPLVAVNAIHPGSATASSCRRTPPRASFHRSDSASCRISTWEGDLKLPGT